MLFREVGNVEVIVAQKLGKTFAVKQKRPGMAGSLEAIFSPTFKEIEAVRDVSLSVEEGETVAFIGPNGAGKSTTIKMLTGILYPTSGMATVLGIVPWRERQLLSREIGTVFGQRSQLWYDLPPRDTFDLLARIYDIPRNTCRARMSMLAEMFELDEIMSTPVRKLSLGQRMRCEIAASLLHGPRVLFLDEPTIGLDVVAKRRIRELIRTMNREEGVTVFLTSHDVSDMEELCRRVMIINHGQLILDTAVSTLKRDYLKFKIVRVRLSDPIGGFDMQGVTVLKHKRTNMKMSVDSEITSIDAVLGELMRHSRIEDITISDPPTEQAIAEIYLREDVGSIGGASDGSS
jgi:ABC-2 type transport system ATP-binding protein